MTDERQPIRQISRNLPELQAAISELADAAQVLPLSRATRKWPPRPNYFPIADNLGVNCMADQCLCAMSFTHPAPCLMFPEVSFWPVASALGKVGGCSTTSFLADQEPGPILPRRKAAICCSFASAANAILKFCRIHLITSALYGRLASTASSRN